MSKTYNFYHKHSSIGLVISADTENEAREDIRNWTNRDFEEDLRLDSEEDEELPEEVELCIQEGKHLTDCDRDGYCNFCGHQEGGDYNE